MLNMNNDRDESAAMVYTCMQETKWATKDTIAFDNLRVFGYLFNASM